MNRSYFWISILLLKNLVASICTSEKSKIGKGAIEVRDRNFLKMLLDKEFQDHGPPKISQLLWANPSYAAQTLFEFASDANVHELLFSNPSATFSALLFENDECIERYIRVSAAACAPTNYDEFGDKILAGLIKFRIEWNEKEKDSIALFNFWRNTWSPKVMSIENKSYLVDFILEKFDIEKLGRDGEILAILNVASNMPSISYLVESTDEFGEYLSALADKILSIKAGRHKLKGHLIGFLLRFLNHFDVDKIKAKLKNVRPELLELLDFLAEDRAVQKLKYPTLERPFGFLPELVYEIRMKNLQFLNEIFDLNI